MAYYGGGGLNNKQFFTMMAIAFPVIIIGQWLQEKGYEPFLCLFVVGVPAFIIYQSRGKNSSPPPDDQ